MVKKILIFLIALSLFSCKKDDPNTHAKISGKITNHLGKDGSIKSENYNKKIEINADGTFSEKLELTDKGEFYSFTDGNEFTTLYLKNGDEINLTLDTKEFDETVKFSGKGAVNNNYLAQKSLANEKRAELFDLDEKDFLVKIKESVSNAKNILLNTKGLDKDLLANETKVFDGLEEKYIEGFKQEKARKLIMSKLVKGAKSPVFNNFENINGKKTSLNDLKGKYVYVDVWATWCGPCKAEIPSLKALEKKYHGKNIEFVSISVDSEKDKDKWKKMIADKDLKGIQLFADKSWKSDFVTNYAINGIPRFILIDKQGNIVNANAPRPSSDDIKTVLKNLNL